jgi:hypothetical protein
MEIDADIGRALSLVQGALPKIRALNEINEDYAASFIEECQSIKAACDHIINFLEGRSNVVGITGGRVA